MSNLGFSRTGGVVGAFPSGSEAEEQVDVASVVNRVGGIADEGDGLRADGAEGAAPRSLPREIPDAKTCPSFGSSARRSLATSSEPTSSWIVLGGLDDQLSQLRA